MMYFRHYLAKFFYNLIWIPWYFTLRAFAHYRVVYEDRSVRNAKGPILVVANHSSWIDPFLISAPFPMFSSIFPIHFAVWPMLFLVPFVNVFVWAMGSFGIHKNVGLERSLAEPMKLLEKGWTVGVFPQGARRRLFGRPRKGRRGAGYLALKKDSLIIPVFVDGAVRFSMLAFFSRKKHITVYVGKGFHLPEDIKNRGDTVETTEFLMQKLYVSHTS